MSFLDVQPKSFHVDDSGKLHHCRVVKVSYCLSNCQLCHENVLKFMHMYIIGFPYLLSIFS